MSDRILMLAQNDTAAKALKRQNTYNSFVDVKPITGPVVANQYKQIMLDEMVFTDANDLRMFAGYLMHLATRFPPK